MKICPACSEQVESHFRFCPIDGSILEQAESRESHGYSPTLISDQPLVLRLSTELQFLIERVRRAWPRFQRHPVAFARIQINRLRIGLSSALARPHIAAGLATALAVVLAVVFSVLVLERRHRAPQIMDD